MPPVIAAPSTATHTVSFQEADSSTSGRNLPSLRGVSGYLRLTTDELRETRFHNRNGNCFFDQKCEKYAYSHEGVSHYGSGHEPRICLCLLLLTGAALSQETAQVTLPSVTLSVAGKAVTAEVADDAQERSMG